MGPAEASIAVAAKKFSQALLIATYPRCGICGPQIDVEQVDSTASEAENLLEKC